MSYGIQVILPDGRDFITTYTPFNVIDAITPTSNGSKLYTLSSGEALYVSECSPKTYGAGYLVNVSSGTVTWSYTNDLTSGSERQIAVGAGYPFIVMRGKAR